MRADPSQIAWVREQIGKTWADGAMGPDAFNCWGLFRAARRVLFEHELPVIDVSAFQMKAVVAAFKSHPETKRWEMVKTPAHGDAVTMRDAKQDAHIGMFLEWDRGGLFHSAQGRGVAFDHMVALPLLGFSRLIFWHPVGSA